jgi:hypothetical protein
VLAGQGWRDILANLPGYQPAVAAGEVLVIEEALPWWRRGKTDAKSGERVRPVERRKNHKSAYVG